MNIAVCTLFEKDYHYGAGALVNSLYNHGFRGVCWAGYRGTLPFWAYPCKDKGDYQEFQAAESCFIRFVKLTTDYHLTNYKPKFMWQILETLDPKIDALFYFDPDIVNKCSWDFYAQWVNCGIAICEDEHSNLSINHPKRAAWTKYLDQKGFPIQRSLDKFFNAGCVGIATQYKSTLAVWEKLLNECIEDGTVNKNSLRAHISYPYLYDDQCVLNAALMLTTDPISSIGPEGMDFRMIGSLMSHAVGPRPKPWQRKYLLEALQGIPSRSADRVYWNASQTPISMYPAKHVKSKRTLLKVASLITRFVRVNAI